MKRPKKYCQFCGKEIIIAQTLTPVNYQNRKYCNRQCYFKAKKNGKIIKCLNCGKEKYISKARLKLKGNLYKYCSRECSQEGRKIGEYRNCQQCNKKFYVHRCVIKNGGGRFCSKQCWYDSQAEKRKRICLECGKEFVIKPNQGRKIVFCSRKCADLAKRKRTKMVCQQCNKEFEVVPNVIEKGKGKYCSRQCAGLARIGTVGPMKGRKHTERSKQKMKEANSGENHPHWGVSKSKSTREKISIAQSGEKAHNWQGGMSFGSYPIEFNMRLKNHIRERDEYRCQLCGKTEKESCLELGRILSVHHIDYDKNNNYLSNLITLCASCHGKTSLYRKSWQNYFMSESNNPLLIREGNNVIRHNEFFNIT